MDIKHMRPDKHREFTGKSNELMLANAKRVAESGKTQLVIRVPVVPTFNATEEEIGAIAAFADSLPGVKKMHLLPYHRLGQDKYDGLGRNYEMAHITPPTEDLMQKLEAAARKRFKGDVQIGG
jgi:pyruvate formate lyase activating enzyme